MSDNDHREIGARSYIYDDITADFEVHRDDRTAKSIANCAIFGEVIVHVGATDKSVSIIRHGNVSAWGEGQLRIGARYWRATDFN